MEYNPLAVILTIAGAYMLIKLRAFFVLHPLRTFKCLASNLRSKRQIKALTLALAGTLGVGNVFGVCIGLIIGGKGSVFWLFVSSVFASVLKYSEVVLAFDNLSHTRVGAPGGMCHTLYVTMGRRGRLLAHMYAVFCGLMALVMGAGLQAGTLSEAMGDLFSTPPYIVGIIFAIAAFVSIVGGVKIIEKITLVAIPLSTIVYIVITGSIIIGNINGIVPLTLEIIKDAFAPESVTGGALAFLFSRALTEGYSRGILSNEAGSGTSSMAHSRSGILNPAGAGLLGIVEVVFDSCILCMLTAYSVLLTVPDLTAFDSGMSLILYATEATLGKGFSTLLLLSVAIFAYATVVCWYYYGESSFLFITGGRYRYIFLFTFTLSVFVGTVINIRLLVTLTDLLMLGLVALTLSAVIKKYDRIKLLSERGGLLSPRLIKIKENEFLNKLL